MSEGIKESLVHNIMDTISDNVSKHKNVSFFADDDSSSVSNKFNRLFGREKPVHQCLGGGKCKASLHAYPICTNSLYPTLVLSFLECVAADVMLWRNKKTSASVLGGATVVWILFEWLNYNFLPLICFALIIGLVLQFLWTNASGMLGSSSSSAPRFVLPEEVFVNVGKLVGSEMNRGFIYLQNVACGGTMKQFLAVIGSLFAAAIIGSCCNFLTVLYIGFISAHTLPIVYEKYEDQIDNFILNLLGQVQHNYKKLDVGVLSRIPRAGSFRNRGKKAD